MLESIRLYRGGRVNLEQLSRQLVRYGYARQAQVADPGEFAVRGGVVDLFPVTYEAPLRIELHGSTVEGLWGFNPKTGELLDSHAMAIVLPRDLRMRFSDASPLEHFVDIETDDLVVHVRHGIGRYRGLERLPAPTAAGRAGGDEHDVLVVEYAEGDKLYVPVEQMHLIQKYLGFEGRPPRLSKLGSQAWARTKGRAREAVWSYARELLELQARRLALTGYAFSPDTDWQPAFERAFPYRETRDQATATTEVKRDMESSRPMDRLLIGDVGYGKTEVAIRAAFKAIMDNKQVCLLVPTTILAEQHARTLRGRLQGYPVTVEVLSRFVTDAYSRDVLARLKAGRCDLVVGTHRLLSEDVRFKDLGLVIIDEEQRFGVAAKERLKRLRLMVDVLVLTATPIPRTLYLSLVGVKEMSAITTPPENRHPVETQVVEWDDEAVARALRQELRRQGQAYVVHNRIHDLDRLGSRIGRLVPEARLGLAHGRLSDEALARVMQEFIEGRLDVLVTTNIIASGIDIPNVNTILIDRADTFGLADLYQLRGRVGRFDRKAYAYLLVPCGLVLPKVSRERLAAIAKHADLGAGFKIAMEDLKIRGAGNMLGTEQHGHVTAVGFDLYCRLLREAVDRLKHAGTAPLLAPASN